MDTKQPYENPVFDDKASTMVGPEGSSRQTSEPCLRPRACRSPSLAQRKIDSYFYVDATHKSPFITRRRCRPRKNIRYFFVLLDPRKGRLFTVEHPHFALLKRARNHFQTIEAEWKNHMRSVEATNLAIEEWYDGTDSIPEMVEYAETLHGFLSNRWNRTAEFYDFRFGMPPEQLSVYLEWSSARLQYQGLETNEFPLRRVLNDVLATLEANSAAAEEQELEVAMELALYKRQLERLEETARSEEICGSLAVLAAAECYSQDGSDDSRNHEVPLSLARRLATNVDRDTVTWFTQSLMFYAARLGLGGPRPFARQRVLEEFWGHGLPWSP